MMKRRMGKMAITVPEFFNADPAAPGYYTKTNIYALNVLLGVPPWWPPFAEVWALFTEPNPEPAGTAAHRMWDEAREFLAELYEEHQRAGAGA
jgi:hypothetical protein